MIKINCIENSIDLNKNHFSKFIIEPLEIGQSVTLGNTFRRIMLNEILSYGILFVKINNIVNELSSIPGLREDLYELLFNLKDITFKEILIKNNSNSQLKGFINIAGPMIITAGNIQISSPILEITNHNQYIGTLLNNSQLYLEFHIGKILNLENQLLARTPLKTRQFLKNSQGKFHVGTSYNPIKFVNFNSKLIHDNHGNISESLILEIMTNGSFTPTRCMQDALKKALNLYTTIFFNVNKNFFLELLKQKN